MGIPTGDWFSRIVGDVESFPLEQRVVHLFAFLGSVLSVAATLGDVLQGLYGAHGLINLTLALALFLAWWLLRVRRGPPWMGLPLMLLSGVGVGVFTLVADGSEGPGLLFLLVLAFMASLSSRGLPRLLVIATFGAGVVLLLATESANPRWIGRHYVDADARLADLGYSWVFAFVMLLGFGLALQRGYAELLDRLQYERGRAEGLLRNVLPEGIAAQLKTDPHALAEQHEHVTVLFADLVGFTPLSAAVGPKVLVSLLDELFTKFDAVMAARGLEKIKTIGDAYMAAAGVPAPRPDHADAAVLAALDLLDLVASFEFEGHRLALRIGIDSGPVVAGVIGSSRLSYDLWGDTVNRASRMESQGLTGHVQITEECRAALRRRYTMHRRDPIEVKGVGAMSPWLLLPGAERPPPIGDASPTAETGEDASPVTAVS